MQIQQLANNRGEGGEQITPCSSSTKNSQRNQLASCFPGVAPNSEHPAHFLTTLVDRQFKAATLASGGSNPLQAWEQYIEWAEDRETKNDYPINVDDIMANCIRRFQADATIRNDEAFLKICLKYVRRAPHQCVPVLVVLVLVLVVLLYGRH